MTPAEVMVQLPIRTPNSFLYGIQNYNNSLRHNSSQRYHRGALHGQVSDASLINCTKRMIHRRWLRDSSSGVPTGTGLIDASNATLLPGLIDVHVPTRIPLLHCALQYGVTTELEMMGHWMAGAARGSGGERWYGGCEIYRVWIDGENRATDS